MPLSKAALALDCFLLVLLACHSFCLRQSPHSLQSSQRHHCAQSTSDYITELSPEPRVEWARFVVNTNLRKQLKQNLLDEGCDSSRGWVRAFERWELHHLCRIMTTSTPIPFHLYDPLVPTSADEINRDLLIKDLANLDHMNEESAV